MLKASETFSFPRRIPDMRINDLLESKEIYLERVQLGLMTADEAQAELRGVNAELEELFGSETIVSSRLRKSATPAPSRHSSSN